MKRKEGAAEERTCSEGPLLGAARSMVVCRAELLEGTTIEGSRNMGVV